MRDDNPLAGDFLLSYLINYKIPKDLIKRLQQAYTTTKGVTVVFISSFPYFFAVNWLHKNVNTGPQEHKYFTEVHT